jgi:hypothetical protein
MIYKYKGGRVCPLPPPSAKPLYGGKAFKRKTKIAEESVKTIDISKY